MRKNSDGSDQVPGTWRPSGTRWTSEREIEKPNAPAHRGVHVLRHAIELVVGGDEVRLARRIAGHVEPHRDVADVATRVDALRQPVDGVQVVAVGLPVPGKTFEDAGGGDVLHGLHRGGEHLGLSRADRGEGHAAVAHHDRGDAVPARRRHRRIPADLRVEVRVQVDEPGRHQATSGVDHRSCAAGIDLADHGDPVAVDRDIGEPSR
jgi:hypothetical protein